MEIFLIVILSLVVFVIWKSSQSTLQQLRDEIEGLQRDVGFLQDKLAALGKPNATAPPLYGAGAAGRPMVMREVAIGLQVSEGVVPPRGAGNSRTWLGPAWRLDRSRPQCNQPKGRNPAGKWAGSASRPIPPNCYLEGVEQLTEKLKSFLFPE
jgi:hypothetical protein